MEPQFFAALLKGLSIEPSALLGDRDDRKTWPKLRELFTAKFRSKSRAEWEAVFDGTDACCTPVLSDTELEASGYEQRPLVTLKSSPGLAISEVRNDGDAAKGQGEGVSGGGWTPDFLMPGTAGEETLQEWMGWRQGKEYREVNGGYELADDKAKL